MIRNKLEFCRRFVHLERKLISFAGRPYLPAVYAATDGNLVLRCSRQTEKSTFLVNSILYEACRIPGLQMLFVCPREEQARVFVRSRLFASLEQSPLLSRHLLGPKKRRPPIRHVEFANGSSLFVRAAFHNGDGCRGISAQLLLVDEFQDMAAGDLPVLVETMSHAEHGRMIITGTPKSIDNHLEGVFGKSTANEWVLDCATCARGVLIEERSLGPRSVICPQCGRELDPKNGRWRPRNPEATWGAGFSVNHLMVPWLPYEGVLARQNAYDIGKFKNEVLGLPTTSGDHVVTRAELEACCGDRPMADTPAAVSPQYRRRLIAGIDWGGGGTSRTVLVIGFMRDDYKFQICRLERFVASEHPDRVLREVARRCDQFRVQAVAADGGGNGSVLNRMLYDHYRPSGGLFALLYAPSRHEPRQDGVLWKWMIDRTASIGALFTRVKRQSLLFPKIEESGSYLDEFACEVAEYDDHQRTVRYSHPETMQDDCLHAANYAVTLAIYLFNAEQRNVD